MAEKPQARARAVIGVAAMGLAAITAMTGLAQAETPYAQGLMWRLERMDVAKPSFILGTMHVTDTRVHEVASRVFDEVRGARVLCLEMSSDDMMAHGDGAPTAALDGEGRALSDLIPEESFDHLAVIMNAHFGVPRDRLQQMPVWSLSGLLTLSYYELIRQAKGFPIVEQRLEKIARKAGKPLCSLETVESRQAAFRLMTPELTAAMLEQAIEDHQVSERRFEDLIAAYLAEDITPFLDVAGPLLEDDELSEETKDAARAFARAFIVGRNRSMVVAAEPELAQGNVVIAVGAAHLPGHDGMLALLEAQGWTVSAVAK